jgi:hypothetical protein
VRRDAGCPVGLAVPRHRLHRQPAASRDGLLLQRIETMNRKGILNDIRHAQRCLREARQAMKNGQDDILLQRLSLAAQYAALASHFMPEEQPGVMEMRNVWAPAMKACEASMKEMHKTK